MGVKWQVYLCHLLHTAGSEREDLTYGSWHRVTLTLDYIKCNTMTKCQKVKVIVVECNDSCSISISASPIFVLELATYGSWQRVTLITMKAIHPTHSKEYLVIIVNCGDHWLICSVFIRSVTEKSWHMAELQKNETLFFLKLRKKTNLCRKMFNWKHLFICKMM